MQRAQNAANGVHRRYAWTKVNSYRPPRRSGDHARSGQVHDMLVGHVMEDRVGHENGENCGRRLRACRRKSWHRPRTPSAEAGKGTAPAPTPLTRTTFLRSLPGKATRARARAKAGKKRQYAGTASSDNCYSNDDKNQDSNAQQGGQNAGGYKQPKTHAKR